MAKPNPVMVKLGKIERDVKDVHSRLDVIESNQRVHAGPPMGLYSYSCEPAPQKITLGDWFRSKFK